MRLIDADDFFERIKNDTDLCAEMEKYGLKALKNILICSLKKVRLSWKI